MAKLKDWSWVTSKVRLACFSYLDWCLEPLVCMRSIKKTITTRTTDTLIDMKFNNSSINLIIIIIILILILIILITIIIVGYDSHFRFIGIIGRLLATINCNQMEVSYYS